MYRSTMNSSRLGTQLRASLNDGAENEIQNAKVPTETAMGKAPNSVTDPANIIKPNIPNNTTVPMMADQM